MAEGNETQKPVQRPLPGVSPGQSDAEKRLAEIEAKDRARREADEKAKRDEERKSADDARKAANEAEAREKAALDKIAAYEKKERGRVAEKLSSVDDDMKARLEKLGAKMSVDDFAELVDATISTTRKQGGGVPSLNPAGPRSGRRSPGEEGKRELPDEAARILDELGVDTSAARSYTVVEESPSGGNHRIVFPAKRMIQKMRERAIQPKRMTVENLRKLRGEA